MNIPLKKGLTSLVTVLVGYAVAVGATALTTACGIEIPKETQTEIVIAATAGVSGLITGALNWLKHRKDKPANITGK